MGLRKMDYERVPQVAVLSSAFFVVSLMTRVPVPPTHTHLILNGLCGVILGWAVFPALLVALLLQYVFFAYGGLTTLGTNTLNMALPAVLCYYFFSRGIRESDRGAAFWFGFAAGALAILLAAFMTAGALLASGKVFEDVCKLVILVHVPVMVIEGFVTGSVVVFLRRLRPELLAAPIVTEIEKEASHA